MSKHTHGEWEALRPKKAGKHWRIVVLGKFGGGGAISGADVHWEIAAILNGKPGDTLETEEANARLMAAAPDAHELLTVLRTWLEEESSPTLDAMFDDSQTWYQKLAAYFAKVEGT